MVRGRDETYLVRCLSYCERTADVCCTAAVHDPIVDDQIPDRADRIVQRTLRLVDNLWKTRGKLDTCGLWCEKQRDAHHLVASSYEYRDCPRVCALLDDEHLVARRAKRDLPHDPRTAELLRLEILEPWYNAAVRCDRDELGAW